MNGNESEAIVHAPITTIANPSCCKRVRFADKTQLPQHSVGSSRGALTDLLVGGTTMLRADVDRDGEDEYSPVETQDSKQPTKPAAIATASSNTASGKLSRGQKRRARAKAKDNKAVVEIVRNAWIDLQKSDREYDMACEECFTFEQISILQCKGPDRVALLRDKSDAELRMSSADLRRTECTRRMYKLLHDHPTIVKHKRGLSAKPPSQCGSFETEFEIYS